MQVFVRDNDVSCALRVSQDEMQNGGPGKKARPFAATASRCASA